MSQPPNPDRFHALDATRAFALLLGVVFHAAWSFVPAPLGGPIVDARAHPVFDWFFFTSHTFRMQLFFLIAGFFARLVYHRRGFGAFARNRLLRIGVPFVLGWLVLHPLVMAAFSTGAEVSGRNLVPVPLSVLFTRLFLQGQMFVPRPSGGMFSLAHLWFLYYLLALYVTVLGGRYLLTRSGRLAAWLRAWADRALGSTLRSPRFIVWLSLGLGLFLWPMGGWFGVDTPVGSLWPAAPVLVFYGFFFVFGWLLHRQAGLLGALARHWRSQVVLALVLSVPLFAAFRAVRDRGAAGSFSHYPALHAAQIIDWPAFLERLRSAADPAGGAPADLRHLWGHLPPAARERILTLPERAMPDERAGVAAALGRLLSQPGLFRAEPIPRGELVPTAEARRALAENRAKLEGLFAGSLVGDLRLLPWYGPVKLAYSVGYALVMWLLIFGTLGFFQARFPEHSPAWRYVADGSYWIYLAHLPLVAALQVWVARWEWPAGIKFLLINLVAFAILFGTYHYLVRSTWVGWLLNGRRYPLVAWPFRRPSLGAGAGGARDTAPLAGAADGRVAGS